MSRLPPLALTLAVLVCASACSQSRIPTSPAPVPTPVAPLPPPSTIVSGRLIDTTTGAPLAGVTVDLSTRTTTTDDSGTFRYELTPGTFGSPALVKLTAENILERSLFVVIPGSREVALDAVALGGGFDLSYYRRLVRDDLDSPGVLRPLRRWAQAPRLYLRTIDEAGEPIDDGTLNTVATALRDEASAWTGGRFGLASLEMGNETREGTSGWITVKWTAAPFEPGICGRAQVAVSGGWILLNYLNPSCGCTGTRMNMKTVRHELGHAMGFWHTSDPNDVMRSGATCVDRRPSARERLHAAIAYGRAVGNSDPDIDPGTTLHSHTPPIVVID